MNIISFDPSISAWGWAVIRLEDDKVLDSGCIKTSPEHKKRKIYVADDRVRRIGEIATCLSDIMFRHDIKYIATETPHGSQNASAAVMIGMCMGLIQGLVAEERLPVAWYNEGDVKKHLFNRRTATKQETITAIESRYGVIEAQYNYQREAIADAIAVYHFAKDKSTTLKMLRRVNGE